MASTLIVHPPFAKESQQSHGRDHKQQLQIETSLQA